MSISVVQDLTIQSVRWASLIIANVHLLHELGVLLNWRVTWGSSLAIVSQLVLSALIAALLSKLTLNLVDLVPLVDYQLLVDLPQLFGLVKGSEKLVVILAQTFILLGDLLFLLVSNYFCSLQEV